MTRRVLIIIMTLSLSVIGEEAYAQDGADSIMVDSLMGDSIWVDPATGETFYLGEVDTTRMVEDPETLAKKMDEKERMDSCFQARYVIVTENGKYGIFDSEKNEKVTEIDMDYISYSHGFKDGDLSFCYFYYEKGSIHGKIGINIKDNSTIRAYMDNSKRSGNIANDSGTE